MTVKNIEAAFVTVSQPIGNYYYASINAEELYEISGSYPVDQTKGRVPYNGRHGIQRKLSAKRVHNIAQYAQRPGAFFPTPIVISAPSKFFSFGELSEDLKSIASTDDGEKNITYQSLSRGKMCIDVEKIIHHEEYLSVVDGQHRLEGIHESGKGKDFELPVVFVFDTEDYQDAQLFTVINKNQRPVSQSLVYELFGLSDDPSVEKFAHQIVQRLNTNQNSELLNNIKMLGYKTDNMKSGVVTQGSIVNKLIPLISSNVEKDNYDLSTGNIIETDKGYLEKTILRDYFIQDDVDKISLYFIGFMNAWWKNVQRETEYVKSPVGKTIGFVTAVDAFTLLFNEKNLNYFEENYSDGRVRDDIETIRRLYDSREKLSENDEIQVKEMEELDWEIAKISREYIVYFEDSFSDDLARAFSNLNVDDVRTISSSYSGAKQLYNILFPQNI